MKLLHELKQGAKYLERFAIKKGEKVIFVRAEDVDSIEAEGNYVRLNLASMSHLLRDTINNVESQIDPGSSSHPSLHNRQHESREGTTGLGER